MILNLLFRGRYNSKFDHKIHEYNNYDSNPSKLFNFFDQIKKKILKFSHGSYLNDRHTRGFQRF